MGGGLVSIIRSAIIKNIKSKNKELYIPYPADKEKTIDLYLDAINHKNNEFNDSQINSIIMRL
jgi:hypothetical protein